jgi:hypothetical protein
MSIRRQVGGQTEEYCVGVDFGQSIGPCAICGMVRLDLPDPQRDSQFVSHSDRRDCHALGVAGLGDDPAFLSFTGSLAPQAS